MEIILKEPLEISDNYEHIKRVLFKRFRLSSVILTLKFEEHGRKASAWWSDLMYELKKYLNSWIESAKVSDFESMKELSLLDQLKKRSTPEIREWHLDQWEKFAKAADPPEKLDR